MATKPALIALFLTLLPVAASAAAPSAPSAPRSPTAPSAPSAPDTQHTLRQTADAVDRTLRDTDDAVARAADDLGRTGLTSAAARDRVGALCDELPYVVNCAVLDARGRLVLAAPAAYITKEGVNAGQRPQVKALIESHRPMVSDAFASVEGFDVVSIAQPIFTRSGRFLGAVTVLARPEKLIGHAVEPVAGHGGPEVLVLQKDGRVLYDRDSEELGRNVFTDPMFDAWSGFGDAMHHLASVSEGSDQYQFLGRGEAAPADERVQWTTVRLHGAEWRVAVAEPLPPAPAPVAQTAAPTPPPAPLPPPVPAVQPPPSPMSPQVELRSLVTIADGHVQDVARDLDLVAGTDDVRSGQWPRIEDALKRVSATDIPAEYWYARSDGAFWTVGEGQSAFNLSDRPYFDRAMSGHEALGDLEVSRSTGRNTGVVAVPVRDAAGNVVGVLGASIYLDQLSARVHDEMGLTDQTSFYAFDQDQQLALYPHPERVLLRVGELGPEVEPWVAEMQRKGQGTISDTFEGQPRTLVYERSPVTGWTYALGVVGPPSQPGV